VFEILAGARDFSLVPYSEEVNKKLFISQFDNVLVNAAEKCMLASTNIFNG
jgi:hypothetical protein